MRARKLVLRLGALAIGLLLAFGVAEIMLRALGIARGGGVFTVTEREYRRVPGIYGPGQNTVDRDIPATAHHVRIDSLGYRGDDFPRVKPTGEFRIFFTGDSFAYGDGVDNDETVSAYLEASLDSLCAAPVRVVNGALHGSSITSQIRLIERALTIDPDLVVVMFSENDIVPDIPQRLWEQLASNRAAKSRFPLSVAYPVLRETALWNFALYHFGQFRMKRMEAEFADAPTPMQTPPVEEYRATYTDTLVAIRDSLARHGIELAYVLFPNVMSVYDSVGSDLSWARSTIPSLGIPTLDATPVLRASQLPDTTLYLLPYDGHADAVAYRLAADALSNMLMEKGMLPPGCVSRARGGAGEDESARPTDSAR